jgi:hypothetical protein
MSHGSPHDHGPHHYEFGPPAKAAPEGSCFVISRPLVRWIGLAGALALTVLLVDAGSGPVHAQGKLDAFYGVTLGGVPIGKGSWSIDVQEDQFTATASGATSGLLRVFASGQGNSAAHGIVSNGQPIASTYASSIVADNKSDQVRIFFSGGADTFVPEACQRTLPVFDGRMRYDLQLGFKHLDKVKSERGYQGTVVVCSVNFAPIAGHIPERSTIKYLIAQRDMEIWLAPIAGTRLMVPYRASVPTPIGLGVLQANQFVSIPRPPMRTDSALKMQ